MLLCICTRAPIDEPDVESPPPTAGGEDSGPAGPAEPAGPAGPAGDGSSGQEEPGPEASPPVSGPGAPFLPGANNEAGHWQLQCRQACLPMCSSVHGSKMKMPCWLDGTSSNSSLPSSLVTGGVPLVAVLLLIASALGLVIGMKMGRNHQYETSE